MSSLLQKFESVRRSPLKFFPKARNSSAFSVEIFVKDFVCCLPELQIISCRRQHLKQDFLQRFLTKHPPPKKNPFNETVNCHTVTLERKNGLWKLLSVTLYCKLWSRLNTPCQSGVVSECGYMFWRMRDSKALKKDHHYIINIVMVFILIIAFTIDGVMDVLK